MATPLATNALPWRPSGLPRRPMHGGDRPRQWEPSETTFRATPASTSVSAPLGGNHHSQAYTMRVPGNGYFCGKLISALLLVQLVVGCFITMRQSNFLGELQPMEPLTTSCRVAEAEKSHPRVDRDVRDGREGPTTPRLMAGRIRHMKAAATRQLKHTGK